jgi:hypothetical protein
MRRETGGAEAFTGDTDLEVRLREALEQDEQLRAYAHARDAIFAVSDRRLIVAASERIALSVRFHELRRIQFDIERDRPATMVVVPEESQYEPQVLAIPPEAFRATAEVLTLVGQQLARLQGGSPGGERPV